MNIHIVEKGNGIEKLINLLGSNYFPGLQNAIKVSANMIQKEWINEIEKSKTKEGWKKEYIRSIEVNFEDDMTAEVFADENNKFVKFVEDGIRRFDMKPGLINGPKSRMGKRGRYNIVFFRKGVPGTQHMQTMSQSTYKKVDKLSKQDIVKRYNVMGMGDKVQLKTKTVKARKRNKTSKGPGGLQKMGSRGHSSFGTFRVVSQNSTGWIYPGVAGTKVYSIVGRSVKSKVKKILQEGLKLDLRSGTEYLKT